MFMAQERLPYVQEMIMAETLEEREKPLAKLLEFQRQDFYGILKAMAPYPVTIRLLDPPLHEFLPDHETLIHEIAELKHQHANNTAIIEKGELLKKVVSLKEANPMLGHRGCRLGITYPEIYRMQARAIFEALLQLKKEGVEAYAEIEIPLVMDISELALLKAEIDSVYEEIKAESGEELKYSVGTMIELPRACLTADKIAAEAEFFSFGTNDLTQMGFGFSRDDAGKFLDSYYENRILEADPFARLDQEGIGKLVEMAVKLGREGRPGLKLGVCGEHGGDPSSVEFFHKVGLDYVSCSPFRVPIARLAAAHAAINEKTVKKA
jgi:pyruvate,orthophosphate dikinase